MTQSMPVKSKLGNGPSSGSSDRNRTAAGVSRNASARQQYSSNSIITEREERASVAIATNLPFSKAHLWDCKFFGVTPEEEGDTCD
jgi:hypothetical protein